MRQKKKGQIIEEGGKKNRRREVCLVTIDLVQEKTRLVWICNNINIYYVQTKSAQKSKYPCKALQNEYDIRCSVRVLSV